MHVVPGCLLRLRAPCPDPAAVTPFTCDTCSLFLDRQVNDSARCACRVRPCSTGGLILSGQDSTRPFAPVTCALQVSVAFSGIVPGPGLSGTWPLLKQRGPWPWAPRCTPACPGKDLDHSTQPCDRSDPAPCPARAGEPGRAAPPCVQGGAQASGPRRRCHSAGCSATSRARGTRRPGQGRAAAWTTSSSLGSFCSFDL